LAQPLAQAAFFAAAGTVQSGADRSRVLKAMIDRDVAWADSEEIARSIEHISGDNEKANLLIKMASKPATPAFLKAVGSINSDNDKRRVIEAMVERAGTADAAKNAVMLAANINSDHDKTQVLAAVAEKYRSDPEVRAALRKAAEKISSDSDYRRIVSKLYVDSGEAEPSRP
jgi:hypothetical protein